MRKVLEIVDFASLDAAQLDELKHLTVSKPQIEFAGSFESSVDTVAGAQRDTVRGFGFKMGFAMVGLVILKRPPSSPEWVPNNAMSLHGLKIDERWQARGLGKQAFNLAVHAGATIWPKTDQLVLSVDASNAAALALYRGLDMTDSGPVFSGRVGKEHRLAKGLCRKAAVPRASRN